MSKILGNTASQLTPRLKEDILNGVFSANEKLVMASLKQRYAIGIGPLREALSQLVVEKLVVVEDQRGYRVHPISRDEMQDLYQTRSHIEAMCAVQAIKKGSVDWEAEVLAAMHRMGKASHLLSEGLAGQLQWEIKHQDFHATIASGCGSASLLDIRRGLYERAARYRLMWLRDNMVTEKYFDEVHLEHEKLLSCVLERDADKAESLMFQHLQIPAQALESQFSN